LFDIPNLQYNHPYYRYFNNFHHDFKLIFIGENIMENIDLSNLIKYETFIYADLRNKIEFMLIIYKSITTVTTISCSSSNYVTIIAIRRDPAIIDVSTILTILIRTAYASRTRSTWSRIYSHLHRSVDTIYYFWNRITNCTITTVSNSSTRDITSAARCPRYRAIIFTFAKTALCIKYLAITSGAWNRIYN